LRFLWKPLKSYGSDNPITGRKTTGRTLKGNMKTDIPKDTPNSKESRLRGLGIPHYKEKKKCGDLYVKIIVQLPKSLTDKEFGLFRQLAELRRQKS
jgi:curved DNA-binding protein